MNPIKIAIAEDHPGLRQSTIFLLSHEADLEVVLEASNGQELLDKLENTEVDIIILDIRMPILDGIETLKLLKIKYPKLKVIMFSTASDNYIVDTVKELGANSFVCKMSPQILVETIKEVVRDGYSYNSDFRC